MKGVNYTKLTKQDLQFKPLCSVTLFCELLIILVYLNYTNNYINSSSVSVIIRIQHFKELLESCVPTNWSTAAGTNLKHLIGGYRCIEECGRGDNKGLLPGLQVYVKKPSSVDCAKDSTPGLTFKTRQYLPKMKRHTAKVKPPCSHNYTLFHPYFTFHRP